MSKQEEQHTENVQRCYDVITECEDMGEALTVLTDTITVIIAHHVETKTDRALLMGACIKRLQQYKKELGKWTQK